MEVASYVKGIYLKNGRHLEVKIGIHTGPVISGVVGDTKPQFSLIGDTVNKASRVCSLTTPLKCTVSKETQHYLELYTNNLQFTHNYVNMKGIGREPIFAVYTVRGNQFVKNGVTSEKLAQEANEQQKKKNEADDDTPGNRNDALKKKAEAINGDMSTLDKKKPLGAGNIIIDSQSIQSDSMRSHRNDSHRGMLDQQQDIIALNNEELDNESNKSDLIDDGTMNVFGFNDDLNLDDRIIV